MRISNDRLTEDIIVALGSGLFMLLAGPFVLKALGFKIALQEQAMDEDISELKQVTARLEETANKLASSSFSDYP